MSNMYPPVMVEIIAVDQPKLLDFYQKTFNWSYTTSPSDVPFAYIKFPPVTQQLMLGIGHVALNLFGGLKGVKFYILVEDGDMSGVLSKVEANQGVRISDPVMVDGYTFAVFQDPEGNIVGLIAPFQ